MLKKLQDLPNFRVAEGSPDIRGWPVTDRDRRLVGRVDSLVVETDEKSPEGLMPVRYLTLAAEQRRLTIPISLVNLVEQEQLAELRASAADIERLPEVAPEDMTAEREQRLFATLIPPDQRATGAAPAPAPEQRGKEETIELRRADVEVERRPVHKPLSETEFQATGGRPIEEEGTIRMPIIGEETVVQKVPYVQEEVILHTTDQTVRETVRKQEAEFAASEPSEAERGRPQPGQEERPSFMDRLKHTIDRQ